MTPRSISSLISALGHALDCGVFLDIQDFRHDLTRLAAQPGHTALGFQALWPLAMRAGPEFMGALVEAGAELSSAPPNLATPLGHAFRHLINFGSSAPFEFLIQAGADPDSPMFEDGEFCLVMAFAGRLPDLSLLLIRAGANPNSVSGSTGFSYLHHAVSCDDRAATAELLQRGASPFARAYSGVTPLELAGFLKRRECAKIIEAAIEARELEGEAGSSLAPRSTKSPSL